MDEISDLVTGFLEASGYRVDAESGGCISARSQNGHLGQSVAVWLQQPGRAGYPGPGGMLDMFAAKAGNDPDVQQFWVVPSAKGMSGDFRSEVVNSRNVRIRVPIQFIDTAFKSENATEAYREIVKLREMGRHSSATRVLQPYRKLSSIWQLNTSGGKPLTEASQSGPDALAEINRSLTPTAEIQEQLRVHFERPSLKVVIGGAGIGKSHLYKALFHAFDTQFYEEKNAQRVTARPLPVTPDLKAGLVAPGMTLSALMERVHATTIFQAGTPGMIDWLVMNGFSILMFDGIDEIYAKDPDFFPGLMRLLRAPGSRAQILVFARDSLVTASKPFRAFLEEALGHHQDVSIEVLELLRWERKSKQALAQKQLLPEQVGPFVETVHSDARPSLREISSLPFYCGLLCEEFGDGTELLDDDEFKLLDKAVAKLLAREESKLPFDWGILVESADAAEARRIRETFDALNGPLSFGDFINVRYNVQTGDPVQPVGSTTVRAIFEEIAHRMQAAVEFPNEQDGVAIKDIRNVVLQVRDRLAIDNPVELDALLLALEKIAFFGPGGAEGTVRFAHEMLADYMAGCHAERMIREFYVTPSIIDKASGKRRDFEDTVMFRYLVHVLRHEDHVKAQLAAHLKSGRLHSWNAKLLVEALLKPETDE